MGHESEGRNTSTPHATGQAAAIEWLTSYPLSALLAFYLLCTGRWGSYVPIPGLPFYIGDITVALAVVQVTFAIGSHRLSTRALARSPLVLLMVMALLGYAAVRLMIDFQPSLVSLRDAAPYAYAVVAILAFLLPVRSGSAWRMLIYLAICLHLIWSVLLPRVPGYPWHLPIIGTDAQLFVIRPDFDATVLGVGAAFALYELLKRRGSMSRVEQTALSALVAASSLGMLSISTRAGLLAGLAAIIAAFLAQRPRPVMALRSSPLTSRRFVVLALVATALASLMAVTPAGGRLLDGFENGAAAGTVSARQDVWARVGTYVFVRPKRAAIGVGFGRDFIAESGSAVALEGTYQNVRSPHNYVVGTLARLGVGGALMVSLIIGLGWWLAGSVLRRDPDPVTVLAALLAISIPIVSMLGVVLESPFGAIPYFWALGQLAAFAVAVVASQPAARPPLDITKAAN